MDTYWHTYYDADTIARSDQLRRTVNVTSTGVTLHVDCYEGAADAPVLILNHGGGGYSRVFVPVALNLYDRGYTVLLPDQRGQGYSEGDRGDYVLSDFVQNIVDVTAWAHAHYGRKPFLAGGSVGGALTYMAAAAGAPVQAIICHNLYDFGSAQDAIGVSRFAFLTRVPGMARLATNITNLLARTLPGLRVPFRLIGQFSTMVDDRANTGFYQKWLADPLPIKWVSLRYVRSMSTTPPAVPFESNMTPVLVINPALDQMTDPALTRHNYERLGGEKAYAEIPYGHWATGDAYVQAWCDLVDDWCRAHRPTHNTSIGSTST